MAYYDTAQICLNGHMINDSVDGYPEDNQEYCHICGEKTIKQCLQCEAYIRGRIHELDGVAIISAIDAPAYCRNCGKPYPWTERKMDAAKELIGLMDELDAGEKQDFENSAIEITTDTPKTKVAVVKIKKYLGKVGPALREEARSLIIDLASETAKKMLTGQ